MKRLIFSIFFAFSLISLGSSNLELMKQNYKYDFIKLRQRMGKGVLTSYGDRVEADALLELATEKYTFYKNYNETEEWELTYMDEVILIMPRIDLLEKHLENLSKKTDDIYLFIMEGDRLPGEYGNRSYEAYEKSWISKNLPKNVQVFKLKEDSVLPYGVKNDYNFSQILESSVFKNQILEIYTKVSKHKVLNRIVK